MDLSNIEYLTPLDKSELTDYWIVILTTSISNKENTIVDTEYRKKLYASNILKWLECTILPIVVIESSGYNFPEINHERLYKYSFEFDDNIKLTHSGDKEIYSLSFVLDKIKDLDIYKNCSHILKVTGRYYLEGIEAVLHSAPKHKDLYLQFHKYDDLKYQNCEYFGMKKELFNNFVSEYYILIGELMEQKLWDFSINKDKWHIGLFNNKIARGGDKLIITKL